MAKIMTKEQSAAFQKVILQAIDAMILEEETGQTQQLVAARDQLDAYEKEFGDHVKIKLGGKK
jgi:hypothetical protein